MDRLRGPDPLVGLVPGLFGVVAECDVVDVEQDLVLALFVPHLMAGVAGVGEDGGDGAFRPGEAGAVGVAGSVVGGWAGDAVVGEPDGDGQVAHAVQVLGEDPLHDACRDGVVGYESVQAFAVGGFGGVGVRARVFERVAVGRSSAEEAAFELGLGGHGGAHPDFDAVAFAFAHAAEDGHDEVVGFVVGVDRSADFGDPQGDVEVDEEGEGVAELVAVEGALGLSDDNGVEPRSGLRKSWRRAAAWGRSASMAGRVSGRSRSTRPRSGRSAGSISPLARRSCQFFDASGSWRSSVEQRPAKANRVTSYSCRDCGATGGRWSSVVPLIDEKVQLGAAGTQGVTQGSRGAFRTCVSYVDRRIRRSAAAVAGVRAGGSCGSTASRRPVWSVAGQRS